MYSNLLVCITGVSKILRITGAESPIDVGSELELQCIFREVLTTNVSWFRDGSILPDSQISTMNGVSTLTIPSVDDDAEYTCTTMNVAGNDSRTVNVDVTPGNIKQ